MDLKPSSWHPDPPLDALEIDLGEPLSNSTGDESRRFCVDAISGRSKAEELVYLKARLQSIGLHVGRD